MGYRERRGGYDRGPREMHKITCSDCGKEDEVPFKPTEGRPVYCQECFQKHIDRREGIDRLESRAYPHDRVLVNHRVF